MRHEQPEEGPRGVDPRCVAEIEVGEQESRTITDDDMSRVGIRSAPAATRLRLTRKPPDWYDGDDMH